MSKIIRVISLGWVWFLQTHSFLFCTVSKLGSFWQVTKTHALTNHFLRWKKFRSTLCNKRSYFYFGPDLLVQLFVWHSPEFEKRELEISVMFGWFYLSVFLNHYIFTRIFIFEKNLSTILCSPEIKYSHLAGESIQIQMERVLKAVPVDLRVKMEALVHDLTLALDESSTGTNVRKKWGWRRRARSTGNIRKCKGLKTFQIICILPSTFFLCVFSNFKIPLSRKLTMKNSSKFFCFHFAQSQLYRLNLFSFPQHEQTFRRQFVVDLRLAESQNNFDIKISIGQWRS